MALVSNLLALVSRVGGPSFEGGHLHAARQDFQGAYVQLPLNCETNLELAEIVTGTSCAHICGTL